ncbi:MAG: damage-inducible protein DinB [Oscillatoriales cyanobacterium C42_A2020_001]|nr:damage-inducible protein DinB [Leptolyngbyaceae cyanobacterium C42_A2020_001]
MIDRVYCQTMAQYNQWMNQNLYAVCAKLSDEERKRDRGAFFKSIHGTLNHLLYGDRVWLGRFIEQPFVVTAIGQELYSDFDELRQEREITDDAILSWAIEIQASWLEQPFEYTSNVDQQSRVLPTWVLVTHLFNHQTHHRGQLTTLLSQTGFDPGITDLPWLPYLSTHTP